jgi:hypothetical protein
MTVLYCEGLKTCNCVRQIDVTYAFLGTFAKLKAVSCVENCAVMGYYILTGSYHHLLHNNPEECGSQLLHSGSLKSNIVSFVMCVFTWKNSASTEQSFMKFDVGGFLKNLRGKFQFSKNLTAITGTVHEGIGKAIPLQALIGPEGSRTLRIPDFKTVGTQRRQGCQLYAPATFTPR